MSSNEKLLFLLLGAGFAGLTALLYINRRFLTWFLSIGYRDEMSWSEFLRSEHQEVDERLLRWNTIFLGRVAPLGLALWMIAVAVS